MALGMISIAVVFPPFKLLITVPPISAILPLSLLKELLTGEGFESTITLRGRSRPWLNVSCRSEETLEP
jgi:hypothetical protein